MQKINFLLAVLFATVSLNGSAAYAQSGPSQSPGPGWVWAFTRPDSVYWIHHSSRVRNGSIVGVWLIGNFTRPRPGITGSYQSERRFVEYHCASRRVRSVSFSYFAEFSARGAEIIVHVPPLAASEHWDPVPPESPNEKIMNIACRR